MVKNLPTNVGDAGFIPGLGRSPGGGNINPLQYSYLENPMDRGTWWTAVHGVTELDMTEHSILREKNDIMFLYHTYKNQCQTYQMLKYERQNLSICLPLG